ncbi:MAG: hypothetical protein BWY56_02025 [Acidobacteria bacterium ADurb.Bin340]|nr:MAG: hypothetical protein BWY56_02025 [Acidobacteria bacterium ADurb.Bin340]
MFPAHPQQGLEILGETTAAESRAGIQEVPADAMIAADSCPHMVHIRAHNLAESGDLVDEADAQGQHGVGGVLRHFRTGGIHAEPLACLGIPGLGRLKLGIVEGLHHPFREIRAASHHDPIRVEEVVQRAAFPQEFRVGNHLEGPIRFRFQGRMDPRGGAHGHGALVHHDEGGRVLGAQAHGPPEVPRDTQDMLQVRAAILALGRAHADEGRIGIHDALGKVAGEGQAAGPQVLHQEFLQARLVDGRTSGAELVHLAGIHIHPRDPMAGGRKAHRRHEAHVSRADHQHLHVRFSRCRGQAAGCPV